MFRHSLRSGNSETRLTCSLLELDSGLKGHQASAQRVKSIPKVDRFADSVKVITKVSVGAISFAISGNVLQLDIASLAGSSSGF